MAMKIKFSKAANLRRLGGLGLDPELPQLDVVLDDMAATLRNSARDGGWNVEMPPGHGGEPLSYSRIPCGLNQPCRPVLLVYSSGSDQFEERLQAILRHGRDLCSQTSHIYLVTDAWLPSSRRRFGPSISALPAGLTIILYAIGKPILLLP